MGIRNRLDRHHPPQSGQHVASERDVLDWFGAKDMEPFPPRTGRCCAPVKADASDKTRCPREGRYRYGRFTFCFQHDPDRDCARLMDEIDRDEESQDFSARQKAFILSALSKQSMTTKQLSVLMKAVGENGQQRSSMIHHWLIDLQRGGLVERLSRNTPFVWKIVN